MDADKLQAVIDRVEARDLQSPTPKLYTFIYPLLTQVSFTPDTTQPRCVVVAAAEATELGRDGLMVFLAISAIWYPHEQDRRKVESLGVWVNETNIAGIQIALNPWPGK